MLLIDLDAEEIIKIYLYNKKKVSIEIDDIQNFAEYLKSNSYNAKREEVNKAFKKLGWDYYLECKSIKYSPYYGHTYIHCAYTSKDRINAKYISKYNDSEVIEKILKEKEDTGIDRVKLGVICKVDDYQMFNNYFINNKQKEGYDNKSTV